MKALDAGEQSMSFSIMEVTIDPVEDMARYSVANFFSLGLQDGLTGEGTRTGPGPAPRIFKFRFRMEDPLNGLRKRRSHHGLCGNDDVSDCKPF